MNTAKSRASAWSALTCMMILAMPMWILADDSGMQQSMERIRQFRQLQNQLAVVKNLTANSKQVKTSPEQGPAKKLSKTLTKVKQHQEANLAKSYRIDFRIDDRQVPHATPNSHREVVYGSGVLSSHPDSLYFNFLTGENSSDSVGMDVRITGSGGTNFGNEDASWGDPSLLYFYDVMGSLGDVEIVAPIDDALQSWTTVSLDSPPAGNGYLPLAVGNIWVVYARTSHMYVALEVTNVNIPAMYFEFDYLIQTDGSNLFDSEASLVDLLVNGQQGDTLLIGSNPYVEILLDGGLDGEFGVIWDGNHNGILDDDDVGLEYYGFTDNDMLDEDSSDGIFGFTYSDAMADGLNYFAQDLLFVAFTELGMAEAPVKFYSVATPFSVSGSIYQGNGGGSPLEGIVIWASYAGAESNDPAIISVTDASGQYHLDLPDSGMVYIGSEDHLHMTDGLIPVPNMLMAHVLGHEMGYDFYFQVPESAIEGTVTDENGTPIEGVEVRAYTDNGPGFSAFTDASGFYSMGLMSGEYTVEIEWSSIPGPYIIPYGETIWVGDFTVATANFTLRHANNSISGFVELDGFPHLAIVSGESSLGYAVTFSSGDGSFELPVYGGLETTYDLRVINWGSEHIIQVSENLSYAGDWGEIIYLETLFGGLYGYFINGATGQPFAGDDMYLHIYNLDTDTYFSSSPSQDGYYEIFVQDGTCSVTAYATNWIAPDPITITIPDSLIYLDMVFFPLENDATLEGYVYDSNGSPIQSAQVQVGNESWNDLTESDESGYYHFELSQGQYLMFVQAVGYLGQSTEVDVSQGPNYQSFNLESYQVDGAIYGIVTDYDGQPIMNAEVHVAGFNQNTDEAGEFWFDVSNGVYDLWVYHSDFLLYSAQAIVVENDTIFQQISMRLPQGGLEGYVYDDNGNGIAGAEVYLINLDDSLAYPVYSDNTGHYSNPASNGNYEVVAWAYTFDRTSFGTIVIDNNWQYLDLHLEPSILMPPEINFIVDQPNDQGRQVRMQFWQGSIIWGTTFDGYSIWRITQTPLGEVFDFVDYIPNHNFSVYNLVAPTLVDSNAFVSDPLDYSSVFMVTGHWGTTGFIDGTPMSGYSVDNIHPGVPSPLTLLSSTADGVEIGWEASRDDDFQYFEVYRAGNSNFSDASMTPTVEPMYIDDNVTVGQTYYYMVKAIDANGNMSEGSNIVSTFIVFLDDSQALPTAYGLSQNYPNPFNPTTSIEFALPRASEVSLEIYNLLGQRVRTLVNGYVPAGYINTSWDGLDQNGMDLSSGTYIYRLKTVDMSFSKKMVLMK